MTRRVDNRYGLVLAFNASGSISDSDRLKFIQLFVLPSSGRYFYLCKYLFFGRVCVLVYCLVMPGRTHSRVGSS